jgi:PAS domain S-box-containing protein
MERIGLMELEFDPLDALESLADGLYITDVDRKILYWNPAAERITGWQSQDVLGRQCLAGILCHVDKDGHQLCGKEHCPLYRSITVSASAVQEVLVFGLTKSGQRVPMRVTTAPLRDRAGKVIGGVETFRDIASEYRDLLQAQRVQRMALVHPEIDDPRVWIADHYVPMDIVGGDFHAMEPLSRDLIAFWIGDVMGHGVSAALYTMQMRCLWSEYRSLMEEPRRFLSAVNERLIALKGDEQSFATAIYGLLRVPTGAMTLVSAGGPPPLHFRRDGSVTWDADLSGVPLGVLPGAPFDTTEISIAPGECLLFYTDGAVEAPDREGRLIGAEGLAEIARQVGFPSERSRLRHIESELLKQSNLIRLPDDLTLLEVRMHAD